MCEVSKIFHFVLFSHYIIFNWDKLVSTDGIAVGRVSEFWFLSVTVEDKLNILELECTVTDDLRLGRTRCVSMSGIKVKWKEMKDKLFHLKWKTNVWTLTLFDHVFFQHLRHLAQRRRSAPSLVFGKALGKPWSPIRCELHWVTSLFLASVTISWKCTKSLTCQHSFWRKALLITVCYCCLLWRNEWLWNSCLTVLATDISLSYISVRYISLSIYIYRERLFQSQSGVKWTKLSTIKSLCPFFNAKKASQFGYSVL